MISTLLPASFNNCPFYFLQQYFISKAHHAGKTEFEKWIALRPMAVCYLLVKHYEHLGQHQQSG